MAVVAFRTTSGRVVSFTTHRRSGVKRGNPRRKGARRAPRTPSGYRTVKAAASRIGRALLRGGRRR